MNTLPSPRDYKLLPARKPGLPCPATSTLPPVISCRSLVIQARLPLAQMVGKEGPALKRAAMQEPDTTPAKRTKGYHDASAESECRPPPGTSSVVPRRIPFPEKVRTPTTANMRPTF